MRIAGRHASGRRCDPSQRCLGVPQPRTAVSRRCRARRSGCCSPLAWWPTARCTSRSAGSRCKSPGPGSNPGPAPLVPALMAARESQQGALAEMAGQPFGAVLLWVTAIGFHAGELTDRRGDLGSSRPHGRAQAHPQGNRFERAGDCLRRDRGDGREEPAGQRRILQQRGRGLDRAADVRAVRTHRGRRGGLRDRARRSADPSWPHEEVHRRPAGGVGRGVARAASDRLHRQARHPKVSTDTDTSHQT